MMNRSLFNNTRFKWLSRSTVLAVAVVILVWQVNTLLSSSFKIELFGVEIFEVMHFDDDTFEVPVLLDVEAVALPDIVVTALRPEPVTELLLFPPPPLPCDCESDNEPEIYVVVEEMPELIGGLPGLSRQIRYPEIAKRAGVEGRVIVQFIVDEEGKVTSVQVQRGLGVGLDEEALRVVRDARFRPGKQRGQPVKVKMSLPITFRLR